MNNINTKAPLNCVEIPNSAVHKATIIWLHGLGADANDFVPLIPQLKLPQELGVKFVFPNAPLQPVTINNGYVMQAWFDIYSRSIDQKFDVEGIEKSTDLIKQLIDKEIGLGIPSENIVLAGFSQGSVIALTTALQYPHSLGGVIALSGYLPLGEKIIAETHSSNHGLPVFIAHGTEDAVVPFKLGETTAKLLQKEGFPVRWKSYPIPHTVSLEEINHISQWLKERYTASIGI